MCTKRSATTRITSRTSRSGLSVLGIFSVRLSNKVPWWSSEWAGIRKCKKREEKVRCWVIVPLRRQVLRLRHLRTLRLPQSLLGTIFGSVSDTRPSNCPADGLTC